MPASGTITLSAFAQAGLVMEVNRMILHPAGFSLVVQGNGVVIEDWRPDPVGPTLTPAEVLTLATALNPLERLRTTRFQARMIALGYFVQPVLADGTT